MIPLFYPRKGSNTTRSWFMPQWLFTHLPDQSKARFKWFRSRNLPCLIHLDKTCAVTPPAYKLAVDRNDDDNFTVVGYPTTLTDLSKLINLYSGHRHLIFHWDLELQAWQPNTGFSSTPSGLAKLQ